MKKATFHRIKKHLAEARRELNAVNEGWFGLGNKRADADEYGDPVYASEEEEMTALHAQQPQRCDNVARALQARDGDDARQYEWLRQNLTPGSTAERYGRLWLLSH